MTLINYSIQVAIPVSAVVYAIIQLILIAFIYCRPSQSSINIFQTSCTQMTWGLLNINYNDIIRKWLLVQQSLNYQLTDRVCGVHSNTINTVAELDHERGNVNSYEDPVVYIRFKTKKYFSMPYNYSNPWASGKYIDQNSGSLLVLVSDAKHYTNKCWLIMISSNYARS